jgi:hypothetical protein
VGLRHPTLRAAVLSVVVPLPTTAAKTSAKCVMPSWDRAMSAMR